ncbi:HU family DNA-binding protein [Thioclava sp. GXIMD4216]|uniref:HU family DNA-binding protein n=1 Tax=Thioclava litoralis TaxID=3076557 RepID=A0ABZ1E0V1_9RHOB|nr:HU family DNA-binding protein [Thioclava sp. FTW29]
MSSDTPEPGAGLEAMPVDTEAATPPQAQIALRKKDLIERVVARSGLKKPQVKAAMDALLEELGEALSQDVPLILPPLGKLRVARRDTKGQGEVMVLKLRRSSAAQGPETADEEEV